MMSQATLEFKIMMSHCMINHLLDFHVAQNLCNFIHCFFFEFDVKLSVPFLYTFFLFSSTYKRPGTDMKVMG